jgi:hypothetical protein
LNQAVTFQRQRPARKTPSNGAGDYLDVKIGDSGQDGNDCHGGDAAMYCSLRGQRPRRVEFTGTLPYHRSRASRMASITGG